jgi:uncharacterized protein (TIGR02246 family)
MNMLTDKSTAEAEVRELVNRWLASIHTQDIDGIVSHYAPDILAFDAMSQLQFKGVKSYKKHWAACLGMCPGQLVFELHDLQVTAGEDVAFSHCLLRCGATGENGEEKMSWMRMTACYRKVSGRWQVVHEHFSVPFDMQNGKALFDLKP